VRGVIACTGRKAFPGGTGVHVFKLRGYGCSGYMEAMYRWIGGQNRATIYIHEWVRRRWCPRWLSPPHAPLRRCGVRAFVPVHVLVSERLFARKGRVRAFQLWHDRRFVFLLARKQLVGCLVCVPSRVFVFQFGRPMKRRYPADQWKYGNLGGEQEHAELCPNPQLIACVCGAGHGQKRNQVSHVQRSRAEHPEDGGRRGAEAASPERLHRGGGVDSFGGRL